MEYRQALENAWAGLQKLSGDTCHSVRFLSEGYEIGVAEKRILSKTRNIPAKDYVSIILLHYLIRKLKDNGLPEPEGEWIDFRHLEGGEGYYATFKKRTIDVISRKYGAGPDGLAESAERLGGKRSAIGDVSVVIEVVEKVPILIALWKADEEFGPEANISYDKSISGIFCTEDIVVLTEILVYSL